MISDKACIYGNVKIGENVRIDDFAILTGNITIGNNVHVGCFCFLSGGEGITIGDYVGISPRVSMFTASDDYSGPSLNNPTIPDEYKPGLQRGPITIGRHCLIGAHTVILPGVTMGEGSSVGAFGLVIKDLTPWTVYFGIPVRAVKDRSKKILDLQRIYEGL
jgi:acetyltransferase-like isoleucine patch superfamily enzyme